MLNKEHQPLTTDKEKGQEVYNERNSIIGHALRTSADYTDTQNPIRASGGGRSSITPNTLGIGQGKGYHQIKMSMVQSNDHITQWRIMENNPSSQLRSVSNQNDLNVRQQMQAERGNYKRGDSSSTSKQARHGMLVKVLSSKSNIQSGFGEMNNSIAINLANNETSTKRDPQEEEEGNSDDLINGLNNLPPSQMAGDSQQRAVSEMTSLNGCNDNNSQLDCRQKNDTPRTATFKVPKNERNHQNQRNASPPLSTLTSQNEPIGAIDRIYTSNINPQMNSSTGAFKGQKASNKGKPLSPSILYLYQPPINHQSSYQYPNDYRAENREPRFNNQFFQLQRFLNKKNTPGTKVQSPKSQISYGQSTLNRASPLQDSEQSYQVFDGLLQPSLQFGAVSTVSQNNAGQKNLFHKIQLELPLHRIQNQEKSPKGGQFSSFASNQRKTNNFSARLNAPSLEPQRKESSYLIAPPQMTKITSRATIDSIIKIDNNESQHQNDLEVTDSQVRRTILSSHVVSRDEQKANSHSMNRQNKPHIQNSKSKPIQKIATTPIDYSGFIVTLPQPSSRYRNKTVRSKSPRNGKPSISQTNVEDSTENSLFPLQICQIESSSPKNKTQRQVAHLTQTQQNIFTGTNTWVRMKNQHFTNSIVNKSLNQVKENHGGDAKSTVYIMSQDESKEQSYYKSKDGQSEMIISPGVKGETKKMPFYHFNQEAQEKLKSKAANSPIKRKLLVKPPQATISIGGKIEPFRNDDSKQLNNIDRSMQMSVSFRGMQFQKGSSQPSQVTVGEIPPTPTPMKTKGIYDKPSTSQRAKQTSRLKNPGLNINESLHIYTKDRRIYDTNQHSPAGPSPTSVASHQKHMFQNSTAMLVQERILNKTNIQGSSTIGAAMTLSLTAQGEVTESIIGQENKSLTLPVDHVHQRESINTEQLPSKRDNEQENLNYPKPESADINVIDQSGIGSGLAAIFEKQQQSQMIVNVLEESVCKSMNKQQRIKHIEEDLRLIKNIYENFEKHQLPVKGKKELRTDLQKLSIQTNLLGGTEVFARAKDALLYEKYGKFQGAGYVFNDEFYLNANPENGIESGELKKREDFEQFYNLRAQNNKQKYFEMLNDKVMSVNINSIKGTQKQRCNLKDKMEYLQPNSMKRYSDQRLSQENKNPNFDNFSLISHQEDQRLYLGNEFDSFNRIQEYNRFAYLLQFNKSGEGKSTLPTAVKKAEVLNESRNEALQRIREKIRAKVGNNQTVVVSTKYTPPQLALESINQQPFTPIGQTSLTAKTQLHSTTRETKRAFSQVVSPNNTTRREGYEAPWSANMITVKPNDPYLEYLSNKTFMLPALSEQKQELLLQKQHRNHRLNTTGMPSSKENELVLTPRSKTKKKANRTMINTLLHMKLQPKLRMTAQDWDWTKEKLDLNLLRDVKIRDKKEESKRLMSTDYHKKPELKLISVAAGQGLRDSQNSVQLQIDIKQATQQIASPSSQQYDYSKIQPPHFAQQQLQLPMTPPHIVSQQNALAMKQIAYTNIQQQSFDLAKRRGSTISSQGGNTYYQSQQSSNMGQHLAPTITRQGTIKKTNIEIEDEEEYLTGSPKRRRKHMEPHSISMVQAIEGAAQTLEQVTNYHFKK